MFIELNGAKHHYTSTGHGPPIVCVHGLGGSASVWHGLTSILSLHHHVVAMDLRGHGRTSASGEFSIANWSKDVGALIDALELPGATVVGHSLGTLIAQHLAIHRSEQVDSLVLLGGISAFEPPVRDLYTERAKVVEADGMDALVDDWIPGALAPGTRAAQPQLEGLLRELFCRNDATAYAKSCRALAKAPRIDRERIGQPTLLAVGDHDRSTPLAMTEELHREIPVSTIRVIPNASHWAQLEAPGHVAATILEHLS